MLKNGALNGTALHVEDAQLCRTTVKAMQVDFT